MPTDVPQPWTIQYFDERLAYYDTFSKRRHLKLVVWLFGTLAFVFVALGVPALLHRYLPNGIVLGVLGALLLALLGIPTYIAATTGAFHREYGICCASCGVPQTYSYVERKLVIDKFKRTQSAIPCRVCGAIIAQ